MAFGKKKTEDEANYGTSDNPVAKRVTVALEEGASFTADPSPVLSDEQLGSLATGQDVLLQQADSSEGPEYIATVYLARARIQLEHLGHFETNQALVSIDAALEWLKKCEGQRT